jgi:CubicO group peptidase (beta-lactamase class C family)
MIKKGIIIGTLFLGFYFLFACHSPINKPISVQDKKIIEDTFYPALTKPNNGWVQMKRDSVFRFYQEVIAPGNDVFSGQFLVAKNGHILFSRHAGYADKANNIPMTDSTPLHVASISKVATALAVIRLVHEKRVKLDEKVAFYLNGFPYPDVTVRMLLNHRSGIPYYGYFTTGIWDPTKLLNNQGMLDLLKKHVFPLQFKAGTHFSYSNTNFALLALIVEKTTGKTFPVAMYHLIFKPLKMTHSFILRSKQHYQKVSKTYKAGYVPYDFEFLDGIYGDKNLFTTAKDLLKLDMATYSKEFIPVYLRKQIFKGYSYEKTGRHNYGLGYRLKEEAGKKTFFFHTGWWHGNTGIYGSLRSDTVSIIAISNVYTKRVWAIAPLVLKFGEYPFNFIPSEQ